MFQSPRSGKFESNVILNRKDLNMQPLQRFNPLDRGNLNQMLVTGILGHAEPRKFQSPRSGKFESNLVDKLKESRYSYMSFQSPRSGKFESNTTEI